MLSATLLLSGALLIGATDTLQTAIVSADRGISVSRTDTLAATQSQTITDILLQSPGAIIADYGGLAGSKSVNLRGLGSPHTTIYIDGIKVSNLQAGQTDLGLLGIESYNKAIIDYAQNSVNFTTERPVFDNSRILGKVGICGGSFGTFSFNVRGDYKLSEKVAMSIYGAAAKSKGNFKLPGGSERTNNDLRNANVGYDLWGSMDCGYWKAKVFVNASNRGTPGTIDWPSTDRQRDRNVFAQGSAKMKLSDVYSLNISSKFSLDQVNYYSEWGDSYYGQREFQLNGVHRFNVCKWLEMSATTEFQWDGLGATAYDASRIAVKGIAGAALKLPRLHANVTVQYEGTFDKGADARNVVSPSADIRYSVTDCLDIVGFARRAFRAATFNELYYPGYGNPDLKPEDAWLSDLGLSFHKTINCWSLKAKADGFYNYLSDKIISAPTVADPNIWLPFNIGQVRLSGLDSEVGAAYKNNGFKTRLDLRYSYQYADNVPYLARHTAVIIFNTEYKDWILNATGNLRTGRKDSYGDMPDWNTIDLSLAKSLSLKYLGNLSLKFIVRNIADHHYEMVTGYPMPGRSFSISIEYNL